MKILSRWCSILFCVIALVLFVEAFHTWPATHGNRAPKIQLAGKAASDYLVQTGGGQSLLQALTVARFGLQCGKSTRRATARPAADTWL
jgi:hypothetical protein